ncbi:MAG: winged helix-turn-helix domain-containing protein [Anaerolineales bacterium]|nr:winged helix-turn-helix domain-containing protein [Anaerolineales bacterium]
MVRPCYNIPEMADNPFYHRGPVSRPEFFFGRKRELAYLFDLLRKGQSVSISGPRRIGKTSLLMHASNPAVAAAHECPPERMEFLLLDGGTLDGLGEADFYGAVRRSLDGGSGGVPYADFLESIRREFSGGRRSLVILLDEFELVASNPRFGTALFNRLRGLAAQYPVRFVTASKNPLWRLGRVNPETLSSPFFNFFAPMSLGLMEEREAREMLQTLSAKAGKPYADRSLDPILSLAGTHPLFLQVAGYRAFESADSSGEVPPEAIPAIRQQMLADLEPHLQYYWSELGEEDRYALAALPMTGGESPGLAEAGLVCGGKYVGTVLEQFVRRQAVPGLLQGGPFLIDLRRSLATVSGKAVHLTPTEFSLLKVFLEKPGRVLAPQDIEAALWPGEKTLDPERARGVVKKLRNALGSAGELLVNRRGQGYLLALD